MVPPLRMTRTAVALVSCDIGQEPTAFLFKERQLVLVGLYELLLNLKRESLKQRVIAVWADQVDFPLECTTILLLV